jgi:hypothetical protein
MNVNSFTKILLLVYGLSIMGNSFMEVGHEALHCIKNTLHHHDHQHHHSVEDHHVNFDAKDSVDSEIAAMSDLCSFFLYFESPLAILSVRRIKNLYPNHISFEFRSLSFIPFIPPPIS